jgi:hypothetical protein
VILSVNLGADSPTLAAREAGAFLEGIGRPWIDAVELGNEPELYGEVGWYRTPAGRDVLGRPRQYDFAGYTNDYSRVGGSLPPVPLAGPDTGGAPAWTEPLGGFLAAEPRVGLVTRIATDSTVAMFRHRLSPWAAALGGRPGGNRQRRCAVHPHRSCSSGSDSDRGDDVIELPAASAAMVTLGR